MKILAVSLALSFSAMAFAENAVDRRIHDELEAGGGHSLGLGQGGMAAVSDISSVKYNPAMIGMERKYSLYGTYHWPTFGRDFYQAGVMDSRTANISAGLLYSGFNEDFSIANYDEADGKESIVNSRLGIAIAQVVGKVSVGLAVYFTQAYDVNDEVVAEPSESRITTFGLGIAGFLTPVLRFGVSAENLGNKKMPKAAPRFLRAGLAYLFAKGTTSVHLDYVNRQRIEGVEFNVPLPQQGLSQSGFGLAAEEPQPSEELESNEQLVVGSFSLKVYDLLRVLGSYGQDLSSDRQSLAAGVAVVNKNYSLSYSSSRPYLSDETAHQAINLSMNISL